MPPARDGRLRLRPGKYLVVGRITLQNRLAYLGDTVGDLFFVVIILFILANLWRVAYAGSEAVAGYTLAQVIWYLAFTETLVLSTPNLHLQIDAEVKGGDIAYRLTRPFHYLGFHYAAFMAETLVRGAITLALGGLIAWLTVGPLPFRAAAVLPVLAAFCLAQTVQFCLAAGVGLLAFWIEDVTGTFLVVDRTRWILGGMLIPLDMLPGWVAEVAGWFPFRDMLYGPARLLVAYSPDAARMLLLRLGGWCLLGVAVLALLYRQGVRRLELNGG